MQIHNPIDGSLLDPRLVALSSLSNYDVTPDPYDPIRKEIDLYRSSARFASPDIQNLIGEILTNALKTGCFDQIKIQETIDVKVGPDHVATFAGLARELRDESVRLVGLRDQQRFEHVLKAEVENFVAAIESPGRLTTPELRTAVTELFRAEAQGEDTEHRLSQLTPLCKPFPSANDEVMFSLSRIRDLRRAVTFQDAVISEADGRDFPRFLASSPKDAAGLKRIFLVSAFKEAIGEDGIKEWDKAIEGSRKALNLSISVKGEASFALDRIISRTDNQKSIGSDGKTGLQLLVDKFRDAAADGTVTEATAEQFVRKELLNKGKSQLARDSRLEAEGLATPLVTAISTAFEASLKAARINGTTLIAPAPGALEIAIKALREELKVEKGKLEQSRHELGLDRKELTDASEYLHGIAKDREKFKASKLQLSREPDPPVVASPIEIGRYARTLIRKESAMLQRDLLPALQQGDPALALTLCKLIDSSLKTIGDDVEKDKVPSLQEVKNAFIKFLKEHQEKLADPAKKLLLKVVEDLDQAVKRVDQISNLPNLPGSKQLLKWYLPSIEARAISVVRKLYRENYDQKVKSDDSKVESYDPKVDRELVRPLREAGRRWEVLLRDFKDPKDDSELKKLREEFKAGLLKHQNRLGNSKEAPEVAVVKALEAFDGLVESAEVLHSSIQTRLDKAHAALTKAVREQHHARTRPPLPVPRDAEKEFQELDMAYLDARESLKEKGSYIRVNLNDLLLGVSYAISIEDQHGRFVEFTVKMDPSKSTKERITELKDWLTKFASDERGALGEMTNRIPAQVRLSQYNDKAQVPSQICDQITAVLPAIDATKLKPADLNMNDPRAIQHLGVALCTDLHRVTFNHNGERVNVVLNGQYEGAVSMAGRFLWQGSLLKPTSLEQAAFAEAAKSKFQDGLSTPEILEAAREFFPRIEVAQVASNKQLFQRLWEILGPSCEDQTAAVPVIEALQREELLERVRTLYAMREFRRTKFEDTLRSI